MRKIRSEEIWAHSEWPAVVGPAGPPDPTRAELWKRREAEGWVRPDPVAGPVEPAEVWDAYAQARLNGFEARLEEVRELALDLVAAMRGERLEEAPLWHLSFILDWRAQHLGPDVARLDHERGKDRVWCGFWDEDGQLRPLSWLDREMMRLNRDEWREEVGLPLSVARWCP